MHQNSRSRRGVRASEQGIERIEASRNDQGWTRQVLADRASVHIDTLTRLIKQSRVDRDTIRQIAKALDLQPTDIVASEEWSPPRVFINACRQEPDLSLAQKLSSDLKAAGLKVFISTEYGSDCTQSFDGELEVCNYFVLLLSTQAAASEIVTEEVRRARELSESRSDGRPKIFPIHIGSSSPLYHDLRGHLEGIQQWEWRSLDNPSTLVQAVLSLFTEPQVPVNLVPAEELPPQGPVLTNPMERPMPGAEPELPVGQVPLASAFYVERPPIESICYQEILQPGALIRVKAPRQMGKTSLMAKILSQAREQGYRTVPLSFQLVTGKNFTDSDRFLQEFCAYVGKKLGLPNRLAEYWDDIFDSNYNSTDYFENYLLAQNARPLVIGLDEVDQVFPYRETANNFMGLLRAWYEQARYGDRSSEIWARLRLVVVHSTEAYIPMNLNQSPFNVGRPVDLPEFNQEQVQDLAQRYRLNWSAAQVQQLMVLVAGHPYLVRMALYQVAHDHLTLNQLLKTAPTEAGPYSDHLRRHLWNLEQYPELATALSRVVSTNQPIELKSELAFKLQSMGLVRTEGNRVTPSCDLYLQYFYERLRVDN